MLLQVMSEDNNFGWSAPGQGLRPILDVGGTPLVVRRLEGTVAIGRPDAASLRSSRWTRTAIRRRRGAPLREAGS